MATVHAITIVMSELFSHPVVWFLDVTMETLEPTNTHPSSLSPEE